MNISKWEFFLIIAHLIIVILEVKYYSLRWENLPDIFLASSNKGNSNSTKYDYTYGSIIPNLWLMLITIFLSFCMPKYGYERGWKGRSLSHNMNKAKRQYRVEISNILCISVIAHYSSLFSHIMNIEIQIQTNRADGSMLPFFYMTILILISWLVHHVLWTRLADKS
jgi:hypothetical protein